MRINSKIMIITVISLLALSTLPIFSVKTYAEFDDPYNPELNGLVEDLTTLLKEIRPLLSETKSALEDLIALLEEIPALTPEIKSALEELLTLLRKTVDLTSDISYVVEDLLELLGEIQPLILSISSAMGVLTTRLEEMQTLTSEITSVTGFLGRLEEMRTKISEISIAAGELIRLLGLIQPLISATKIAVEKLIKLVGEMQTLTSEISSVVEKLIKLLTTILPTWAGVFVASWEGESYYVPTLSNSTTVTNFNFNQPSNEIGFDVAGPSGTVGFCAVAIENELIGGPYVVLVDDSDVTPIDQPANGTHSFLYFTYSQGTRRVRIIGATVIPEFTSAIIMPLLMIAMVMAIMLGKKCLTKRRDAT